MAFADVEVKTVTTLGGESVSGLPSMRKMASPVNTSPFLRHVSRTCSLAGVFGSR